MDPDRWQRIQEVFGEVIDIPPAERHAALDRKCQKDPALRQEIESLLTADEAAGRFIQSPLIPPGDATPPDALKTELRVGPYKLLRSIGHGGMSSVYVATRDDDYQRRVAVKIFSQLIGNEDRLRRFRTERQILAALEHLNIARLYDGGTTDQGAPYFVMEYVEGLPIDEYCDRHRLSVRERVELFRQVCSAVHYAHQNLVVHRDLKPGNILVTTGGVPKLLDFGIAKLLNPDLSSQSPEPTATWMRLMTPSYASPEQARGKMITTASDVYSLGVLLYKLLTGKLPYRFEGQTAEEIEQALADIEPEKPSYVVGQDGDGGASAAGLPGVRPEQLRRQLAGDLDNILLMTLRKEPQRRYGSAELLSEDLRRFLEGLPVLAGKASLGYRIGKFLRRHRIAVAVAALVTALIVGFATAMAMQSSRVARERDEARRERDKSEQVLAFVEEVFRVGDPESAGARYLDAREIFARGTERIEALHDQPGTQAFLMTSLGNIYRNLGLFEESRELLEGALEARRELLGEAHPDTITTLSSLGRLHQNQGRYHQAETIHRRVLALRENGDDVDLLAVSQSLGLLAEVLLDQGAYEEAEPAYRRALEIRSESLGEEHPQTVQSLGDLGSLLWVQGRHDEAELLHRRALRLLEKKFGGDHLDIAETLNNLAMVLVSQGESEEAEELTRRSLEIRRRLLGEEHPDIVQSLSNLAVVMFHRGDYEAVEKIGRECLNLGRRVLGEEHPRLAHVLLGLGSVLARNADPEYGEELMREAVAIRRVGLPAGHWLTGYAESRLGAYLTSAGRFEEAEPLVQEGYRTIAAQRGDKDREAQRALAAIVDLYQAWGKPDQASEYEARLLTAKDVNLLSH